MRVLPLSEAAAVKAAARATTATEEPARCAAPKYEQIERTPAVTVIVLLPVRDGRGRENAIGTGRCLDVRNARIGGRDSTQDENSDLESHGLNLRAWRGIGQHYATSGSDAERPSG